jgi:hypothetical protein
MVTLLLDVALYLSLGTFMALGGYLVFDWLTDSYVDTRQPCAWLRQPRCHLSKKRNAAKPAQLRRRSRCVRRGV